MSYTVRVQDDAGRVWVGGNRKGESAEKTREHNFDTLQDAISHYEKIVDWGFAGWERVVSIIDNAGEVVATKKFETPRGVPIS